MPNDETVHPDETGADEKARLWDEAEREESGTATAAPEDDDQAQSNASQAETNGTTATPASSEAEDEPRSSKAKADTGADQIPGASRDTADAASQAADPWADASPEMRAAKATLDHQLEQERTEKKRIAGTVSGLQRKINDLERQLKSSKPTKDTPKEGASGDGKANGTEAAPDPLDDEQFGQFEKDYPELAKPIGALRGSLRAANTELARVRAELGGISDDQRGRNIEAQFQTVLDAHPDYESIKGSDQFTQWYAQAPAYIRAGVERNADDVVDGQEVAHIVNLFKVETGWKSPSTPASKGAATPTIANDPKRQRQLESASAPKGRGPAKVSSDLPDPDDREAAWEYFERKDRLAAAS